MTGQDTTGRSFWKRPLVIPPGLQYRRELTLTADAMSHERIRVVAQLADQEHQAGLTIEVDTTGIVQAARFEMAGPFRQCTRVKRLSHRLFGLGVQRDADVLAEKLVDARGCIHALELASAAFLFATNVLATARVGWDVMHPPGPQTFERMREAGCDGCVAFGRRHRVQASGTEA